MVFKLRVNKTKWFVAKCTVSHRVELSSVDLSTFDVLLDIYFIVDLDHFGTKSSQSLVVVVVVVVIA